uniref:Chromo domain-containing protein n=1 Tax=Parascaris univalens TaxID=6257 RepID=A0A915C5T1_PARUN
MKRRFEQVQSISENWKRRTSMDRPKRLCREKNKNRRYIVEKVVDKRVRNGVVEYFVSWKGLPPFENTWEAEDNLDCPEVIQAFEARRRIRRKKNKRFENDIGNGFERGLEPESILGALCSEDGEVTMLIKWKGREEADLVPAKLAIEQCPQLVIRFHEERFQLNTRSRV